MKKRDLYYERIPTKLLRENVRYLGTILGKVIRDQEGEKFFKLVEKVRKLSKANKKDIKTGYSYKKIIQTIKNLDPKNTFKLTRAFTHFMNLMNLSEYIDASRSLNEYENSNKKIDRKNIFIEEIFEGLLKIKISAKIKYITLQKI